MMKRVRDVTYLGIAPDGRKQLEQKVNNDALARNGMEEPIYNYQKLDAEKRPGKEYTISMLRTRRQQLVMEKAKNLGGMSPTREI